MPTLLHKDVTNHECNWRTVIYCINYFSDVVNCLLKLQVIAMPILYHILYIDRVLNHLRQYCQMLPQEVMYFCIFMYFPMAWETLLLRLPGHQFLQVFGHWWSWLLGLWQSNVLKKISFAVGFLEIQEHEAKKAFEAGWVQFHVCSTWHNQHHMGVWCGRCFRRVPIPRSQKIQKKHFTGFDSGDSGNAWVLPCFCLNVLWFSMLEMLWIPTSRLGSSSKVSFSEHNLASLLQTTCSLPDGWRLISQMFNTLHTLNWGG